MMILRKKVERLLSFGCLVFICFYILIQIAKRSTSRFCINAARQYPPISPPCRLLRHGDEVLLIVRTGATEIAERLPVHLETTLRCSINRLSFSDHEEWLHGVHIQNALQYVSAPMKAQHPDFELYRRLKHSRKGRATLRSDELSSASVSSKNSKSTGRFGKPSNPGWKLDKWKFLPMMNLNLAQSADHVKWFIFVETDTYLLWNNLVRHLFDTTSPIDWRRDHYIGLEYVSGNLSFAHGGSGFAMSRSALEKVVAIFSMNQAKWEAMTANHWAGDVILATALKEVGIEVTEMKPWTWQSVNLGKLRYDEADQGLWCSPAITFHHMRPHEIERLWSFEMSWLRNQGRLIHHGDLYNHYVLPQIEETPIRKDWNNHASTDYGPVNSVKDCRAICEALDSCMQYMLSSDRRCLLGASPSLGEASLGETAGWILERMRAFARERKNWCLNTRDEG